MPRHTTHSLALFTSTLALAQTLPIGPAAAAETREQVAIIDQSTSMSALALDPEHPLWNRLEVTKAVFPVWLDRLPQDSRTGIVTVGGECGKPPTLKLDPGTDRNTLKQQVAGLSLAGQTPLNQVLESVPTMFSPSKGEKRVVLFTDGGDSCGGDTCAIARDLYARHGIVVDVVVLGMGDRELSVTAQCITTATTGRIIELTTTTQVVRQLTGEPPPPPVPTPTSTTTTVTVTTTLTGWIYGLVWWHIVTALLGILATVAAARVVYKHLFHPARWSTSHAVLLASLFAVSAALTLVVALFTGAAWLAAVMGLLTVVLMLVTVTRPVKLAAPLSTRSARDLESF